MYRRALPRLSDNADLLSNIGQLFYQVKDMGKAIEWYHRAIAIDAAMVPRIAHLLALAYHYNGEYELAEKYYGLVEMQTAQYHFDFAVTLERLGKVRRHLSVYALRSGRYELMGFTSIRADSRSQSRVQ